MKTRHGLDTIEVNSTIKNFPSTYRVFPAVQAENTCLGLCLDSSIELTPIEKSPRHRASILQRNKTSKVGPCMAQHESVKCASRPPKDRRRGFTWDLTQIRPIALKGLSLVTLCLDKLKTVFTTNDRCRNLQILLNVD